MRRKRLISTRKFSFPPVKVVRVPSSIYSWNNPSKNPTRIRQRSVKDPSEIRPGSRNGFKRCLATSRAGSCHVLLAVSEQFAIPYQMNFCCNFHCLKRILKDSWRILEWSVTSASREQFQGNQSANSTDVPLAVLERFQSSFSAVWRRVPLAVARKFLLLFISGWFNPQRIHKATRISVCSADRSMAVLEQVRGSSRAIKSQSLATLSFFKNYPDWYCPKKKQ